MKHQGPFMTIDEIANLPYRPCVGVMLVNRQGMIWVGRRLDTPNGWQMPQGGIVPDEDPCDAALREPCPRGAPSQHRLRCQAALPAPRSRRSPPPPRAAVPTVPPDCWE